MDHVHGTASCHHICFSAFASSCFPWLAVKHQYFTSLLSLKKIVNFHFCSSAVSLFLYTECIFLWFKPFRSSPPQLSGCHGIRFWALKVAVLIANEAYIMHDTSYLKFGIPVATLPNSRHFAVCNRAGWPYLSILWPCDYSLWGTCVSVWQHIQLYEVCPWNYTVDGHQAVKKQIFVCTGRCCVWSAIQMFSLADSSCHIYLEACPPPQK